MNGFAHLLHGGSKDLEAMKAKYEELTQKDRETMATIGTGTTRIKELKVWQTDANVQREVAGKKVEDTKQQLAKEIAHIREEQADARATMGIARTKLASMREHNEATKNAMRSELQELLATWESEGGEESGEAAAAREQAALN